MTLWHGRFDESMAASLFELSESFSFDQILWPYDLQGSEGHVRGLVRAGLISAGEGDVILAALRQVGSEFADGSFERHATDEDIHTAIERRITELAGEVGAKLHTARSRNDQVATALRLFVLDQLRDIGARVLQLIEVLDQVAMKNDDVVLPGYTHLQRAQPVLASHHLRAHCWALLRDVDRISDALERTSVSPLGAGALAGSSFELDTVATASDLGFTRAFDNSLDAVSDRDFVAEALFVISLIGVHCSRFGEELVLWTTSEFGFATLGDAFTTGSSMLPHKKNADVAELARGKAGRFIGHLSGLLATLKGLPLSYNRDLQEDKEPLFDAVRQIKLVLAGLGGAVGSLQFNAEVTARAANDELLVAIDLAEWLVIQGVAFRDAHERVGALVGDAVRSGRSFHDVVAENVELSGAMELFAPGAALARRLSRGGAGPLVAEAQRERLVAARAEVTARLELAGRAPVREV